MRTRIGMGVVGVVVLAVAVGIAGAQSVPQTVNYQGRLLDDAGQPVTQQDLPMDFALYNQDVIQQMMNDEMAWLDGSTVVSLMHQDLVPGSEVVTYGATVFETPRDYLMDYPNGTIARVPGGQVPNGTMVMVDYQFTDYGWPLWSEAQLVDVGQGIYNVRLGAVNPLTPMVFSTLPNGFLEVTVSGEKLSPRAPLSSVPYALNAALLEGNAASSFAPSSHSHTAWEINGGTLGTSYYSSYSDLGAENYLNNDADTDLLTRLQADGRFAPNSHNHSGANITSGTIGSAYFSAYSDLSAEGYLDNSAAGDLLTQTQGDGRFVNAAGDDSMSGALTIGGNLVVSGGKIGVGGPVSSTNGVTNRNAASFPQSGAVFVGTVRGIEGLWATDTTHYGFLGMEYMGVRGHVGDPAQTGNVYGGFFDSESADQAIGVQAEGISHSASNNGMGIWGIGENTSSGPAIGGYFSTTPSGTGTNWGVYAFGGSYGGQFEWLPDRLDHYARLGAESYGVFGRAGNSDETGDRCGGRFESYTQNISYGVVGQGTGYGTADTFGGLFTSGGSGLGNKFGVYGLATSVTGKPGYGIYGYASGLGTNYGIYNAAGTKNWVNPDPEDPGKAVVYSTLEGGENGTYWRGTGQLRNGRAEVVLPDHFRKVTSPDDPVTAVVSPLELCNGLAVVERTNERIVVEELLAGKSNAQFDFIVMGKRLGYEEFNPYIENVDYVPFQGNLKSMDAAAQTTQEWYDNNSPGLKKIWKKNGVLRPDGKINEQVFQDKGWKIVKEKPLPAD